jgi:hypothetical protein
MAEFLTMFLSSLFLIIVTTKEEIIVYGDKHEPSLVPGTKEMQQK